MSKDDFPRPVGVLTPMTPGWHFCAMKDGSPVLRDGTPLEIGRTYEHPDPVMCKQGLHDSVRVIDALRYAPGPFLCRTASSADVDDEHKRCSRFRRALVGVDVSSVLHEFSARIAFCALLAEHEKGREPDPRSWNAVRAKMLWCKGEMSNADLIAAESAAWNAARSAARSAADSAASSAARSAADSAASSAARSAARSAAQRAAWSAADSAAESAAWNAADSAAESAAWNAAWSAAWSEARSGAEILLLSMLPEDLKESDHVR